MRRQGRSGRVGCSGASDGYKGQGQALTYNVSQTGFDCEDLGEQLVTLLVSDPCGNTASCSVTVIIEAGIAPCAVEYNVVTNCLNNATSFENGQFEEVITIKSLAGQVWTVSNNTGLFTANSANPPVSPVAIPDGTSFTTGTQDGIDNDGDNVTDEADEVIYYTLKGRFTECVGYTVGVTNSNLSFIHI